MARFFESPFLFHTPSRLTDKRVHMFTLVVVPTNLKGPSRPCSCHRFHMKFVVVKRLVFWHTQLHFF